MNEVKISCSSVMVTVSYSRRAALASGARRSPSVTGSRSSLALAAFLAVTISGGKAATADIWHPTGQMQWQWVLQTPVDTGVNVPVFEIDGFDNHAVSSRRCTPTGPESSATPPPGLMRTGGRMPAAFHPPFWAAPTAGPANSGSTSDQHPGPDHAGAHADVCE